MRLLGQTVNTHENCKCVQFPSKGTCLNSVNTLFTLQALYIPRTSNEKSVQHLINNKQKQNLMVHENEYATREWNSKRKKCTESLHFKSTYSCRGSRFDSKYPHDNSQPFVTPFLEDMTPPSAP